MQEDNKALYQMRFPQKLWYLINLRTDAILWGGTGRTILLNYRILHEYLLCDHSVFKTNNISSFVRQLNLYGFRKVTSHLQDPLCNSSNPFMHEYIHDFFQYGRPELLNKILRKALNIKKSMKNRPEQMEAPTWTDQKMQIHLACQLQMKMLWTSICNDLPQSMYLSPLQKARRTFRLALKNAAQNLYIQHSSMLYGYEDAAEDSSEDDVNTFYSKTSFLETNNTHQDPVPTYEKEQMNGNGDVHSQHCSTSNGNIMDVNEESACVNSDTASFPNQFLSMPDLDPEPVDTNNDGIELLGEFHINNDTDQGITKKVGYKKDVESLNCVLPSINNDYNQNDDVMEFQDNNMDSGHYRGEWEQMFNDMISKGQNQECGSDLKELYSQISRTIDLLNS